MTNARNVAAGVGAALAVSGRSSPEAVGAALAVSGRSLPAVTMGLLSLRYFARRRVGTREKGEKDF